MDINSLIGVGVCVLIVLWLLVLLWYHEMRVMQHVDRYRADVMKKETNDIHHRS